MGKIKFEAIDSLLDEKNKFKKATIRYMQRDLDDQTNPVPLIMAMLAVSKARQTSVSIGFDYTFPLTFD